MYGLKYECFFDPIGPISSIPVYKIEILQKGYSGEVFDCKGGATPVLHQWETDDPKAAIKGSSLSVSLINDGPLPLSSFFSTEDDGFKVRFKYFNQVLFEGFLVQDDCSEPMVDFTHEINLSANDNLGLLKDVPLNKSNVFELKYTSADGELLAADFNNRLLLVSYDFASHVQVGDKIQVSGTPVDGVYTVKNIVNSGPDFSVRIDVIEPIDNFIGTALLKVLSTPTLIDKVPLLLIVRMCLSVTGLELNTNIFGKINEVFQTQTEDFFSQTLIDPQTFLKSDTEFTDCYDALTKVLERFNMTVFQANGEWNIVRWDELRYYNNLIEGYKYDYFFNVIGTPALGEIFTAGTGESIQAETGLLRKICRPFSYDKETFNYQQPRQLLRNYNLQELGSLIKTYTTGSGIDLKKINEYNVPWWYTSALPMSVSGSAFIRITSDDLDNEIERVLVVNGDVKSYQIEVNKNDSFKFSFSFKTQDSQPGNVTVVCIVELNDGTTRKFFHNPALTSGTSMWQSGVGFAYNILSGDNSNSWHTVEIDCSHYPIPYDGLLYCYLRVADLSGTKRETYYKDIRFEYTPRINESTKIIGHTHTQSQTGTIKNNEETEIFIDSSPRNSIAGTLFLNEKIGVLQKRTELWRHPYFPNQSMKLGDLMTFEQLFWRRIPRTILEGSLYGLISGGAHISLLSVFKYNFFPSLNFVFGRMEIDYKNNKVDGTLWEMWSDEETDNDLLSSYLFEFLYSTK